MLTWTGMYYWETVHWHTKHCDVEFYISFFVYICVQQINRQQFKMMNTRITHRMSPRYHRGHVSGESGSCVDQYYYKFPSRMRREKRMTFWPRQHCCQTPFQSYVTLVPPFLLWPIFNVSTKSNSSSTFLWQPCNSEFFTNSIFQTSTYGQSWSKIL